VFGFEPPPPDADQALGGAGSAAAISAGANT
jgi:hypothetical protein